MSNKDLARRTVAEVCFDGVDISTSVRKYLLSLTYTDNEEDEADDLQINLEDRDGIWLTKWLNAAVQAAAVTPVTVNSETAVVAQTTQTAQYKVTAKSGLNVRSGPGTNHGKLGALAHGTIIDVYGIENGWASIKYSGKDAYVSANYIEATGISSGGTDSSSIAVGAVVQFIGGHHYVSSNATSPTGSECAAGPAKVTQIASGAKHPYHLIHTDSQSRVYGWVDGNTISGYGDTVEDSADSDDELIGLQIQAVIVRENWNGDGKDTLGIMKIPPINVY